MTILLNEQTNFKCMFDSYCDINNSYLLKQGLKNLNVELYKISRKLNKIFFSCIKKTVSQLVNNKQTHLCN